MPCEVFLAPLVRTCPQIKINYPETGKIRQQSSPLLCGIPKRSCGHKKCGICETAGQHWRRRPSMSSFAGKIHKYAVGYFKSAFN